MTEGMDDLERPARSAAPEGLEGSSPRDAFGTETSELPDLSRDDEASDPLGEEEILDINRRFAAVRRSVGALEKVLLQGPRKYSRRDLSEQHDIPERLTSVYWRSLGFTPVDEDTVVFTEEDAYAIGDLAAVVEEGAITERAFASISRGMGFHMGRLAMWITEALVDEAKHADGLDDARARQQMLDAIPELLEIFESQVMFTFRRQLAAYAARAGSEVLHRDTDELFPLQRAVGFADLVQFTRLAQDLPGAELADMVGRFEQVSRDIISVGGGRVVKTVGDEIMFLADTPEDGAQIAVSLAEAITEATDLPPVRVGLSWGSMFSRYGDVFGPTVNLAARMESVARPAAVLVDADTAAAIAEALPGGFSFDRGESVELHGIGEVRVREMRREGSAPLDLGL
ncbi:adenylate/guanylate cyclase domain-containing protein [Brachybacterium saurashtrense]|uniref:Adenylate/guanylate cyclase domain-containing protein n=1 Tax=Brachybacterium saurashtrense TaxID=556288 RepID=A0A345YNQ6_9MICO|nr:adenylate/guanylate cyclase domain-containing protein [Brachybacterium saurashtrense]AXK45558.1 adenylate/guanylate cyclase domain-containing protein [Brachybacterium saurashtrense]RRR21071.1 adenylate/guanylate cyclase domain-containing protein [Brachybacterium saurashtrense]